MLWSTDVEANFDQCPLCGTELSRVKLREIEAKLHRQEQEKAAEVKKAALLVRQEIEQRFKQDLQKHQQIAEKKAREEAEERIRKIAVELDAAARKLKEAEAKEVEIRMAAQQELAKQKLNLERKAKEEGDERIKQIMTERDQIAKKLKVAQEREAEILKQMQLEAEKQRQKDLAEQRQALEKDKTASLLKQESKFTRDRESLQRKVQLLERQLQKKTANELGDGAEIDLFDALRESFPGDKVTRIPKGQAGADVLLEVLYKGESCGKIVIDSKNRQSWQNAFVSKLRQDQVQAAAEHAILATTVFPAGEKEMCIEGGVIVMAPARVVYVVELLRQAMVTMHIKGLSIKERETKMTRLYKLITSEVYSSKFAEANKLTQEILDLEVQEQTAHGNVWKKRGSLLKRIYRVLREAETEVAAIVEGEDRQDAPAPFSVKSIRTIAASASTRSEGIF
jgi:hypothetical protein